MTNLQKNLVGNFDVKGSILKNDSIQLVRCHRKHPNNKPVEYLLLKSGVSDFEYISSLYPDEVNQWTFDYQGAHYTLLVESEKCARINKSKIPMYNNRNF